MRVERSLALLVVLVFLGCDLSGQSKGTKDLVVAPEDYVPAGNREGLSFLVYFEKDLDKPGLTGSKQAPSLLPDRFEKSELVLTGPHIDRLATHSGESGSVISLQYQMHYELDKIPRVKYLFVFGITITDPSTVPELSKEISRRFRTVVPLAFDMAFDMADPREKRLYIHLKGKRQ